MKECLDSSLKEFKYSVLKPKKFYSKIIGLPEYQDSNISYSQFRNKNISFDIFEAAFLNINNNVRIDENQLRNIFIYLNNSMRDYTLDDVKNIIKKIERLNIQLVVKLNNLNRKKDKIAWNNINDILEELKIFKKVILESYTDGYVKLENEIKFELLLESLLYPTEYNDNNLLITLFYNLPVLHNNIQNEKIFNDTIYKAMLSATYENNKLKRDYYIKLVNYISKTNIYQLNKKNSNIFGLNQNRSVTKTYLAEKINKLHYTNNEDRYVLDDYIISIDANATSNFDDAISVEKTKRNTYILGIHIADVYSLGIILKDDKNSIYNGSQSKASLSQGERKNAISLFVEIDKSGLIIDRRILRTNIEVNRNLLYEDVSKILINKYKNNELCDTIINLVGLYNIVYNSKLNLDVKPSAIANSLVQKYMLLYGCIVSDIASENDYPILYQQGKLNSRKVTLEKDTYDTGFLKNNLNTYARLTSPIWDIRSLINQAAICQCIFDKIDRKEKNNLKNKLYRYKNDINKTSI